jgi:GTP pyrophosphokinase
LGGLGALADDKLEEVAQTLHQGSLDLMYAALGYGGLGVQTVIGRLGLRAPSVEVPIPELPPDGAAPATSEGNRSGAVSVMGVGDLLTRMAPCCKPVPGDEIIGYITRGKGITVHRRDCHNVRSEDEPERLVHVDWGRTGVQSYPVTIRVEAYDREGLLRDVATVVTEEKLNITGATVDVSRNGIATIMSTVEVGSLQQLSRLLARIEKTKDVIRVSRDVRSGLSAAN